MADRRKMPGSGPRCQSTRRRHDSHRDLIGELGEPLDVLAGDDEYMIRVDWRPAHDRLHVASEKTRTPDSKLLQNGQFGTITNAISWRRLRTVSAHQSNNKLPVRGAGIPHGKPSLGAHDLLRRQQQKP